MIMKHHKPSPARVTSQVFQLGAQLSFLDVLRDACARNDRYTLTLESEGRMFTVLVDRNGPFNAIGGGAAGGPALVAAAQLRSGSCTVALGWPVDQPLYQPGLDLTLRALVEGAVEPAALPRHRGVDSLRNQEWRDEGPAVPAPQVAVPQEVRTEDPAGAASDGAAAPVLVPPPAAFPTRPWVHRETAERPVDTVLVAEADGPRAVGGARQFATQALLWLCEVDEPESYSLKQAATIARHSLVMGLAQAVHPLRREMDTHIGRIKQDWDKSGEAAARAGRRRRKPGTANADGEFRLF